MKRGTKSRKNWSKQASPIPWLEKALGNSLAPFRFLTPFSIRSSRRLRNSLRSDILDALLRRVPCLAMAVWWKTVRKAERAWFLSGGEESEVLRINGAWPHLFWGQKQRVLEPYSLSPSSMVAAAISQNLYFISKTKHSWCKHLPKTIKINLCYTYLVLKKCGLDKSSPKLKRCVW